MRLFEVVLPIPKDDALKYWVAAEARQALSERIVLRTALRDATLALEGDEVAVEEEAELEEAPV